MKNDFAKLQEQLGYKFENVSLLEQALCHKSYINESKRNISSYERLEFLGDSVLSVVISRYIYDNYSSLPEGELTKLRASVVCENTLSEAARKLNIGDWLLLSKGEKQNGGNDKSAILCDVFESVIAAIYLDGDMNHAKKFILDNLKDIIIEQAELGNDSGDYKTNLQEFVQRNGHDVDYRIVSEHGPDHAREYEAAVYINDKLIATGTGTSKKKAQQVAAKNALIKYQKTQ